MSEQTENTAATGTDPALAALTDAEKIALTGGADFWHTHGAPSAGLPGVMVTDGPHGLRAQQGEGDNLGLNDSVPATCFPPAVGLAATWSRETAAAVARAIARQEQGGGTSVQHYALNNQETDRMRVDVSVDERTLHEIYLRAFRAVVTRAQPWTVMCSYNSVLGELVSQNRFLLTEVLREQWG